MLYSAIQFCNVFIGIMHSMVLAGVCRRKMSEKQTTCNVLPRPMEWARMHPKPASTCIQIPEWVRPGILTGGAFVSRRAFDDVVVKEPNPTDLVGFDDPRNLRG